MSDETFTKQGLTHGRAWSTVPADGEPVVWSVDPQQGLVQGPLDLDFLRGQKVTLNLEPGQLALLIADEDIQAVYLDGCHCLDIGRGRRQISPDHHLLFLTAGEGLTLRWNANAPLRWGRRTDQALIGTCQLEIDRPDCFYRTFVAGADIDDSTFLDHLLEQIVRGVFEDLLGATDPDGATPGCGDIQSRLTSLRGEDLADNLSPYGLCCRHLAVYTAEPPVVDAEGRRDVPAHSAGGLQTSGLFDGIGHN